MPTYRKKKANNKNIKVFQHCPMKRTVTVDRPSEQCPFLNADVIVVREFRTRSAGFQTTFGLTGLAT